MNDKNNNPIGIFDSGIGGLSVLKEAIRELPSEDFIYFCDAKNVPYGNKKASDLKEFIGEGISFLIEKKVKTIVLACNTATSIAADSLRERYPTIPIIGMEPAIKPAVESCRSGKVIVLATPVTLEQEKFWRLREKIDDFCKVTVLPAANLATMIERHMVENHSRNKPSEEIKEYLDKLFAHFDLSQVSTIVLGCTHYAFIKPYLKKLLPSEVKIVDGNEGTIRYLKEILEKKDLLNDGEEKGTIKFYSSGYDSLDIDKAFRGIMENYLE